MSRIRSVGAVLGGMVSGGLCVAAIQQVSNILYPPPGNVDTNDWKQLSEWIGTLPVPAFLLVLLSWAVGPLVGAFVARLIATNRVSLPSLVVIGLFLAATVSMLVMLPHPVWMWPAGILACCVFGIVGWALAAPSVYIVHDERSIDAATDKVFNTLASVESFSEAVPGITNIEFLSEQRRGVGTRFRETRIMHGKEATTVLEVTEHLENERVRIVSDTGGAIWDTVFLVTAEGKGTRMRMAMEARPHKWLAKLMVPMVLGVVRSAVRGDMDAVQTYCESPRS